MNPSNKFEKKDFSNFPKHFNSKQKEADWQQYWKDHKVYTFDPESSAELFIVDTPPPTVSGSLHIGHVFSYSHTDFFARYKRMKGFNIFYPMGWDDNGLPTERRVQNYYHIQCDPEVPYEEGMTFPIPNSKARKKPAKRISRLNFIEVCNQLTQSDEEAFKALWQRLGLSVDWEQEYTTIGKHAQKVSQYSFLDLHQKGHLYLSYSPTMWDVDFQTAIAQAEVEDRLADGHMYTLHFQVEETGEIVNIGTTRPELLPACVGMTAHPDDERYQHLFGKNILTPLFGVPVPCFSSDVVNPEKGTGLVMVCTFGDATDMDWWKLEQLKLRQILNKQGRLMAIEFGTEGWESIDAEAANTYYAALKGKTVFSAKKAVVELLQTEKPAWQHQIALQETPTAINRPVKYYEKGRRPLEFISTRQWFVHTLPFKEELIERGREIEWHPPVMRKRYEDWTNGLKFDWCISRQRYFGVPIPVWYPINELGDANYSTPILPTKDMLPIDPLVHVPPGYTAEQRGQAGGFTADKDIFDTWFTSSLTPQINAQWVFDEDRHERLFPASMRPQAHEIIRTWAFYTILKAHLHHNQIPWEHVAISGWILDPNRKKMSKSKGNVVTPADWLDKFTTDGVRYWAARAKLGVDTTFDQSVMKIGSRLVTKMFNAGKFVYGQESDQHPISQELDLAFVDKLRQLIIETTDSFENFEHFKALQLTETAFWNYFTDSFIELVKVRAATVDSAEAQGSAVHALRQGMHIFLRLFAPFLPYITEEVWSWVIAKEVGNSPSVHTANWPTIEELAQVPKPKAEGIFDAVIACFSAINKHRSNLNISRRQTFSKLTIQTTATTIDKLKHVATDLKQATNTQAFDFVVDENGTDHEFVIVGELVPVE